MTLIIQNGCRLNMNKGCVEEAACGAFILVVSIPRRCCCRHHDEAANDLFSFVALQREQCHCVMFNKNMFMPSCQCYVQWWLFFVVYSCCNTLHICMLKESFMSAVVSLSGHTWRHIVLVEAESWPTVHYQRTARPVSVSHVLCHAGFRAAQQLRFSVFFFCTAQST